MNGTGGERVRAMLNGKAGVSANVALAPEGNRPPGRRSRDRRRPGVA